MTGPAAACARSNCEGCRIQGRLICLASPGDVLDFAAPSIGWLIPFLAGMISGRHWLGLLVWLGLAAVFFGCVEAWLLCRHCPAYAEKGATLRCHANWGLPKLPRLSPRPMNRFEQVVWLIYVVVLFLYHLPFFIQGGQWLLLVITTWAFLAWVWTVQRTQCSRCFMLSCPLNRVPQEVRAVFYQNFPDFAAG